MPVHTQMQYITPGLSFGCGIGRPPGLSTDAHMNDTNREESLECHEFKRQRSEVSDSHVHTIGPSFQPNSSLESQDDAGCHSTDIDPLMRQSSSALYDGEEVQQRSRL